MKDDNTCSASKVFGGNIAFCKQTNIFDGHAMWYVIECDCNIIMSRLKITLTQWLGGTTKLKTIPISKCFRFYMYCIVFKHSNFKLLKLQLNYPTRGK